jgi:hypothetical protein
VYLKPNSMLMQNMAGQRQKKMVNRHEDSICRRC